MTITATISAAPPAPSSASPATFETDADTYLAWEETLDTQWEAIRVQVNAEIANLNALGLIALGYTFSTLTADADPGAGVLRLGAAPQNTAVVLRADVLDALGVDVTALLDTFGSSSSGVKGYLVLAHRDTPTTKYIKFRVSAVASPAGYRNITIVPLSWSAASPFANNDPVVVIFQRNGDNGLAADLQGQIPNSFTTAGTGSAYTGAPAPAIAAYAANQSFFVTFHAASGAAPTLQISGLAAPPNLVAGNPDGTFRNIAAGEITVNWRSRVTLLSAAQALVERLPAPLGSLVDHAYVEYTTNADLTTVIPVDDTIPQNTEGTQVLSVSFTPKSVTNKVRARFQGEGAMSVTGGMTAAIFSSAAAGALRAAPVSVTTVGASQQLVCEHEYVPGTTAPLTFSVRVGPTTGTMRLNGNTSGRLLGGASAATLVIEEFAG